MILSAHPALAHNALINGPASPCKVEQTFNLSNVGRELSTTYLEPSSLQKFTHLQKKKLTSPSKRVSFSDRLEVAYYDPPTAEELEASWLQKEDKNRIRHDSKLDVLAYHKVGYQATRLLHSRYCLRGLEKTSSKRRFTLARYMRKDAINAVLLAQKETGGFNPGLLRLVSETKSREMVKEAIKMAAKDSSIWLEELRQFGAC